MKAVTFTPSLPISAPGSLVDADVPAPTPGPRDLLVEVRAISVNPVDTKIRKGGGPGSPADGPKLLGWDAAGVVKAVGADVTLFEPGDAVYYAGAVNRSGTYGELHAVDERIVGRKPESVGFAEAAALPLTTITAWELLFDRIKIRRDPGTRGTVLIIGGAGGVGSIATQLVRQLTGMTVIATASRPDTVAFAREMGAHHVVNHREPLPPQLKAVAPGGVDVALVLTRTAEHYDAIVEMMAPQGAVGLIDNVGVPLDIDRLKLKCVSIHWEFMFGRSLYTTADIGEQGRLLNEVSALVDRGVIATTTRAHFGTINAANLKRAHALIESGSAIGKIVLEGF